jgi:hypothetical protein
VTLEVSTLEAAAIVVVAVAAVAAVAAEAVVAPDKYTCETLIPGSLDRW